MPPRPRHPLFLEQTEARRAEKFFSWRLLSLPPPLPPPPPPLSEGLDPPLALFLLLHGICVSVPTEGAWLWIEKERP